MVSLTIAFPQGTLFYRSLITSVFREPNGTLEEGKYPTPLSSKLLVLPEWGNWTALAKVTDLGHQVIRRLRSNYRTIRMFLLVLYHTNTSLDLLYDHRRLQLNELQVLHLVYEEIYFYEEISMETQRQQRREKQRN